MRETLEQIEVFYADDGTRFLTKQECEAHETAQRVKMSRLKCTQFYDAVHSPDLTEGRGWYGRLFIAVEGNYATADLQSTYAMAALVTLFGNPLAFVQGSSPTANWRLSATDMKHFEHWKEEIIRVGDYSYHASALFISNKGAVDGWPQPCPVSELCNKEKLNGYIAYGLSKR